MKRFLPLLLLFALFGLPHRAFGWDDNWTQARSGDDYLYDPDSSQGKAGTPVSPLNFFTSPTPDFADVDPEEQADYFGRFKRHDYVPYALARITQDLHYGDITIPKGYYLLKPGNFNDGSPKKNLQTEKLAAPPAQSPPTRPQTSSLPFTLAEHATQQNQSENRDTVYEAPSLQSKLPTSVSPAEQFALQPLSPETTAPIEASSPQMPGSIPDAPGKPKPGQEAPASESVYRVFILKQMGKVIAVFPIHQVQSYTPERKDKVPKHALAWMETDDQRPALKFYYQKRLYTTYFQ